MGRAKTLMHASGKPSLTEYAEYSIELLLVKYYRKPSRCVSLIGPVSTLGGADPVNRHSPCLSAPADGSRDE